MYNQGTMTRGYQQEGMLSLSLCPVLCLSKTLQLLDERHEGVGDNCNVLERQMNGVFSKYLGGGLW